MGSPVYIYWLVHQFVGDKKLEGMGPGTKIVTNIDKSSDFHLNTQ